MKKSHYYYYDKVIFVDSHFKVNSATRKTLNSQFIGGICLPRSPVLLLCTMSTKPAIQSARLRTANVAKKWQSWIVRGKFSFSTFESLYSPVAAGWGGRNHRVAVNIHSSAALDATTNSLAFLLLEFCWCRCSWCCCCLVMKYISRDKILWRIIVVFSPRERFQLQPRCTWQIHHQCTFHATRLCTHSHRVRQRMNEKIYSLLAWWISVGREEMISPTHSWRCNSQREVDEEKPFLL